MILETENYPESVITAILGTAEVLKRMLDKANFDSGERKYSRNLVCSGALSDRSNEGGPPRQPQRSAATLATRGKEAQFFSGNRPIFGSAIHRPVTLRQPEKRVA